MARWRLTEAHYLNVPGTVWEFSETDRTTGKQKRTQFPVPTLLNPAEPSDWNYKTTGMNGQVVDGEIIVCYAGKGQPRDIEFLGEPTPSMEPLDEEAEAISGKFTEKWKHPTDSVSSSFGDALIEGFQKQMELVQAQQSNAKVEGMTELLTAMAGMMKQNQDMMMMLMSKTQVVDQEPPLEEIEPTAEEVAEASLKRRA